MRVRLGLPPTYVLYLGINKPHKNLRTLVAAWGLVGGSGSGTDSEPGYGPGCAPALGSESGADSGPVFDGDEAAQLVLAGRWDDRYASVVGDASRLAPVSSVRFLGPVTEADLRPLYSGAAAFAFPSRYEGFGLPPLEAMACGTPVVASDSSSLPEVVGDAGLLVPADDVAAWADALRRVLADRALAADLRRRSLLRAATFGWDRTARLTRSAYVRTAAGGSGSAQQE
jgi:alpha-1,3-rhamnosyl/mannosyltransferase